MSIFIKYANNFIFVGSKDDFDLKRSIMHFLEEYNLRRTHSSTQVIPKELFTSNSEQLKAQVQERLLKLNKYHKPRLDAVASTKIALKIK